MSEGEVSDSSRGPSLSLKMVRLALSRVMNSASSRAHQWLSGFYSLRSARIGFNSRLGRKVAVRFTFKNPVCYVGMASTLWACVEVLDSKAPNLLLFYRGISLDA